ncbi:MAG: cyanophycinase [Burkholderiales bacterium]|nr:cyanophycinase [Bacteroidia bacterium]
MPLGGGEDSQVILERIITETGKKKPKICYMTIATTSPKEAAQKHKKFFKDMGMTNISIIHFDTRKEADIPGNLLKIKTCHAVYIGGGDQLRLSSLLGGTIFLALMKKRYYEEPKFVICGNSAGAAAMSNTMIISGSSQDALIKGELELTNGLNLINNVFIDTHFTQRGRFGRLIQTLTYNPGVLGLGLSLDTGVIIYGGDELEVIGTGLVVIADGTFIQYTDLTEISNGDPITVEGIKMHVLGPGKRFSISERKLLF